jgi:hypothetical protein
MDQRGAAQKQTLPVGATLHSIKTWLDAPVVFGRRAKSKSAAQPEALPNSAGAASLVLHVCWLSILLGLAVQIALLAASAAAGRAPKLNPLLVDLAQRITWSTIVCSSISVALAASKMHESFMGLAGMLSAAAAFKVARSVQKGVGAALSAPVAAVHGPSPLVLGIIKAVEYGWLAAILAWMAKRDRGATAHAAVGLATGLVFGAIVLGYTYWTNSHLFSAADVVSRGLNEVLFPVGCSLVLFATEAWGKHWNAARAASGR